MNMDTVHKEPNFTGVVVEVDSNSILVSVNEGEEARKSSDLIDVSLNVELKDSMTEFMSGDEVKVYYNGTILESYPAQLEKVYAILLKSRDWTNLNVQYATYEPTAPFRTGDGALLDGILRKRRGCIIVEIKDGSDVLPFFPANITAWDEAKNALILDGTEYMLDSQVSFGGGYTDRINEDYTIPKWFGDPEKAFIVSNHGLPQSNVSTPLSLLESVVIRKETYVLF
jgi:ribosomal protein L21E